ncbi:MAG: hypothetical protein H7328_03595 [Bdellovibrio sp.]|nr:hypothetical protein [Bdellovibrio sp.]
MDFKKIKNVLSLSVVLFGVNMLATQPVFAAETATDAEVQTRYQLTGEEIKMLQASSISHSQYDKVGRLSRASGKSIEEVLKMRTEQKMGWGKIAKTLGVDPKELGQSVADSHREDKMEKRAEKAERKERQKEMKEKREEAKKTK